MVIPTYMLQAFLGATKADRYPLSIEGLQTWAACLFPDRPIWRDIEIFPSEIVPWAELISKVERARAHFEQNPQELVRFLVLCWSPRWASDAVIQTLSDPITKLASRMQDLEVHGVTSNNNAAFTSSIKKNDKNKQWQRKQQANPLSQPVNQNAIQKVGPVARNDYYKPPSFCWAHQKFGDRAWPQNCNPLCTAYESAVAKMQLQNITASRQPNWQNQYSATSWGNRNQRLHERSAKPKND